MHPHTYQQQHSGALDVVGLTKRYGSHVAIRGAGFSVRPGEVVGIIGPNGAGKTTLLEVIAGILPCDDGEIRWNGIEPSRRRDLIFYLPDGVRPYGDQYVEHALGFFAAVYRRTAGELGEIVNAVDVGVVASSGAWSIQEIGIPDDRARAPASSAASTPVPSWPAVSGKVPHPARASYADPAARPGVHPFRRRRDQSLDQLVSKSNDLVDAHVAADHALGQARLKRLINNQAAGGKIRRVARHELRKFKIFRPAAALRVQYAHHAVRVSAVGHQLDFPYALPAVAPVLLKDAWTR
jgi:energy-coupling factor transporter ATP-binding protein EcfA2